MLPVPRRSGPSAKNSFAEFCPKLCSLPSSHHPAPPISLRGERTGTSTGTGPDSRHLARIHKQLAHWPRSTRDLKQESPGSQAEGPAVGGARPHLLSSVFPSSAGEMETDGYFSHGFLESMVSLLPGLFTRSQGRHFTAVVLRLESEGAVNCSWGMR